MAGDLEESSRLEGGSGVEEDGMEEEKEESSQVVVCRTSALFASWVYVDLSSPQLRELICPGSNAGKATIPATSNQMNSTVCRQLVSLVTGKFPAGFLRWRVVYYMFLTRFLHVNYKKNRGGAARYITVIYY